MSTEPFIGEVKLFGFDFAPRGYQFCAGQLLSISSNTALFSLLGTTYGGNGIQTFGLPDLRGRVPIGQGQGPGLPDYEMGEIQGSTQTTILNANMPAHTHSAVGLNISMPAFSGLGEDATPVGNYMAATSTDFYAAVASPGASMGPLHVSGQTGISGGSIPISIVQPLLVMNYCIATVGIFPSRQ
ncbi:tail fiber protein [Wandonia haliotis]|uniref:Tail fiber protein n=1 Tax=Wandonia haliotis TaxID=574963 RepID=A0ABP3Y5E7_9FLAO